MSLEELVGRGHHAAPAVTGIRRAAGKMIAAGAVACLLAGVVIPVVLAPSYPPVLADVPAPVPTPAVTPLPDLVESTVAMRQVTESTWSDTMGDSQPVEYSVPRIMQAGSVLVQWTGLSVAGEDLEHGRQVLRVTLVDALTGDTIGTTDIERVDGEAGPPVELARLREPRATYLTVASEVRNETTGEPIWHHWTILLQFMSAR